MITYTIDSYGIQSQSYKLMKKLPKIHILEFCKKYSHETHHLELLDKMYE